MNDNLKAIILAAGQGTRLRPFTDNIPKCLVQVDGMSILDRQLSVLRSRHINDIVLIGGHCAHCLQGKAKRLYYNDRYRKTNMLTSLFCAKNELTGTVLLSYGDIVYSTDILDKVLSSPADIAIAIDMNWKNYWSSRMPEPLSDLETLHFTPDNIITEIGKKPSSYDDINGQFIGLIKFTDNGLNSLKTHYEAVGSNGFIFNHTRDEAYMTDLLQLLIDNGVVLTSVPFSSPWVEIDTVSDLSLDLNISRVRECFPQN